MQLFAVFSRVSSLLSPLPPSLPPFELLDNARTLGNHKWLEYGGNKMSRCKLNTPATTYDFFSTLLFCLFFPTLPFCSSHHVSSNSTCESLNFNSPMLFFLFCL